jgi:salicylate hydroxylase
MADLIIASDGIHSIAVYEILGRPNPPQLQDHYNSCYRFLIPTSELEADPETANFTKEREGRMSLFADNEGKRRLICYPCRKYVFHLLQSPFLI